MRRMEDGTAERITCLMRDLAGRHLGKRLVRVRIDHGDDEDGGATQRITLVCAVAERLLREKVRADAPREQVQHAVGQVLASLPIELPRPTMLTKFTMHDRCCFRWQTREGVDVSHFAREVCRVLASTFPRFSFCLRSHPIPCESGMVENQILIGEEDK